MENKHEHEQNEEHIKTGLCEDCKQRDGVFWFLFKKYLCKECSHKRMLHWMFTGTLPIIIIVIILSFI